MRQRIVLLVGCVISAGSLYLVFRDVDFGELARAVGSFELVWLIPSGFFFYLSMYLRGARWAVLFRPDYRLSGVRLFRPLMIGFAFNSILPARVGEFVRAIYVGSREGTGFPLAMTTVVAERAIDGVTLLAFLGGALALLPDIDPNTRVAFWGVELGGETLDFCVRQTTRWSLGLVAAVVIFMIPAVPRGLARLLRSLPYLSAPAAETSAGLVLSAARGLEAIRSLRNLVIVLGYSILVWGLIAVSNLTLAYGFQGLEGMTVTHAFAIVALIAVFIIIPAAPGYWGLFEAGVIFGLKVFDIQHDESIGTAYALVLHLLQYVPIVAIGLFFAAQAQVRVRARPRLAAAADEAPGGGNVP